MDKTPEFVVLVTDELKKLVGRGGDLKWLARCFTIRKLAGVDVGTKQEVAGLAVREYLVESINALAGSYEFEGRWREASELKPVFRTLLGKGPADIRRNNAIELYISEVTWRKDREWKFLYILAEHLTTT